MTLLLLLLLVCFGVAWQPTPCPPGAENAGTSQTACATQIDELDKRAATNGPCCSGISYNEALKECCAGCLYPHYSTSTTQHYTVIEAKKKKRDVEQAQYHCCGVNYTTDPCPTPEPSPAPTSSPTASTTTSTTTSSSSAPSPTIPPFSYGGGNKQTDEKSNGAGGLIMGLSTTSVIGIILALVALLVCLCGFIFVAKQKKKSRGGGGGGRGRSSTGGSRRSRSATGDASRRSYSRSASRLAMPNNYAAQPHNPLMFTPLASNGATMYANVP